MRKGLLLSLLLPVVTLQAAPSPYDGVAAYVNDKVVTVDTVMKELHSGFDLSQVPMAQRADKVRELFPVVRDLIVDRMLILKAYEDSGAQLPNEAVTERIQAIVADEFGGDEARLTEMLRRNRMTKPEWIRHIRENMIVSAMRQLQVGKKTVVSPRRVKEYFAEHMDEFAEEGGVRVRVILIPPAQGAAAAEAALAELKKGVPFEEVAKKYSSDAKAKEGGDWGFVVPEATFAPAVAEALRGLKVGEHSGILEQGGYRSIVQKAEVRKGRRPTLAEAWPAAEAAVRAQLGQERYKVWLEGLRKAAYIKHVDVPLK